jgi:hypothetical protein
MLMVASSAHGILPARGLRVAELVEETLQRGPLTVDFADHVVAGAESRVSHLFSSFPLRSRLPISES